MGGLVVHLAAKAPIARAAFRHGASAPVVAPGRVTRRRFLGLVGATSLLLTVVTIGQTLSPLRRLALLAPRRPDVGDAGFPVNRSAAEAAVATLSVADARLEIRRRGRQVASFSLADLTALPQRHTTLPIACVEGWSASRHWSGVAVGDVLAAAGVTSERVEVVSREAVGRYRQSTLMGPLLTDPDTLLAVAVDGAPLTLDHGAPLRLIAPNRPGVLLTKWVAALEIE
jgi:DMSO/TMAO reductase YedYZ molybdopterin-dependent catalytic subunit